MTTYDAIVVGARVAGASTAMLLARAGATVLLLERSPYGSDTVSTHGLMRAGVLQLSRWGLLDQVAAAGTPPVTRTLFHYLGSSPVRISIRASHGVPALFAPRRQVLDRILVDAAVAAGVEVRHGVTVTELLSDAGGRVTGVRGVDADHGTFTAYARTTVGRTASGPPSLARWSAGRAGARPPPAPCSTATSTVSRPRGTSGPTAPGPRPGSSRRTTRRPASSSAALPSGSGWRGGGRRRGVRRAVRQGGPPTGTTAGGRDEGRSAARLVRAARARPPVARRRLGAGRRRGLLPRPDHHARDDRRPARRRAAGRRPARDLGGQQPEAIALAGYQATRDRLSVQLFDVSDRIAGYAWDPTEIQQLLREVSSAMSDEVGMLQSLPPRPARPTATPRPVAPGMGELVAADTPGTGR